MLHNQAVELAHKEQYQQSLEIMNKLFKTNPNDKTIISDYITILQWAGQNEQAWLAYTEAPVLGHYTQILGKSSANADSVVEDAVAFINTDKYIVGKMLFELVLAKYPKQSYRIQYADTLVKKQLNRSAYRQYQLLSDELEGQLVGLSGMVRTASLWAIIQNPGRHWTTLQGNMAEAKRLRLLRQSAVMTGNPAMRNQAIREQLLRC